MFRCRSRLRKPRICRFPNYRGGCRCGATCDEVGRAIAAHAACSDLVIGMTCRCRATSFGPFCVISHALRQRPFRHWKARRRRRAFVLLRRLADPADRDGELARLRERNRYSLPGCAARRETRGTACASAGRAHGPRNGNPDTERLAEAIESIRGQPARIGGCALPTTCRRIRAGGHVAAMRALLRR